MIDYMAQNITPESLPSDTKVCLLNPAMMPDWFWDSTGEYLNELGIDYVIPKIIRDDITATAAQNVEIIEEAMGGSQNQFMVALSRGIELSVRYIDRLNRRDDIYKMLGWMVISSVGPRGSEALDKNSHLPVQRHTEQYSNGITTDSTGLEQISETSARKTLLNDIHNEALIKKILRDMVHDRPLTPTEIEETPDLTNFPSLPLSWYIGRRDQVDNKDLSEAVARTRFDVIPKYTSWSHIAPSTHPKEVAVLIAQDLTASYQVRRTPND